MINMAIFEMVQHMYSPQFSELEKPSQELSFVVSIYRVDKGIQGLPSKQLYAGKMSIT